MFILVTRLTGKSLEICLRYLVLILLEVYVDEESGEIVLQEGDNNSSTYLHESTINRFSRFSHRMVPSFY